MNFIYIASCHRKTCSRRFTLDNKIHFVKEVCFKARLNDTIHSACLNDVGREFHSCGPQTLNAPLVTSKLVSGTINTLSRLATALKARDGTTQNLIFGKLIS